MMILVNWFQVQLVFVTLLYRTYKCKSEKASCGDIGCASKYINSSLCQCNTHCRSKGDCCSDYNETCRSCRSIGCRSDYNPSRPCQCNEGCLFHENCCWDYIKECGFCHHFGCGSKYDESRPCQCNKDCRFYKNCCEDYNGTCGSCQGIGCGSRFDKLRPCQCNKPCRSKGDCCSDYDETCGLKVANLNIIIPMASVFTLGIVIGLLVYGLKRRKERAKRVAQQLEDRHYYEINNLNEGSFGVVSQLGGNSDKGEWNVTGRPSTALDYEYGRRNVVRNVAYESCELNAF